MAEVSGLTSAEVLASRSRYGENVLSPPPRIPWWRQYLGKFNDPVIRILLIAAVLATLVGLSDGHFTEGIGIIVAVFLATFLAFWNEFRANREFDVLNKTNDDVPVKVFRDGQFSSVPRREIVVGDTVLIELGEEIPADGTLQEAVNLLVDESKLTGESIPVVKSVLTSTSDNSNRTVRRGTTIVDGRGTMQVTAVGDRSEIGQTLRESTEESEAETPLTKQLTELSKLIGVVGFAVAVLAFFSLVGQAVGFGTLGLSNREWLVVVLGGLTTSLMLSSVWVPIVYDGVRLFRPGFTPPEWLGFEGIRSWIVTIGLSVVVFLGGMAILILTETIPSDPAGWLPRNAVREFLRFFLIAVTIVVVAVPEGLAMSVTLSLAYSMRKMMANNNLVRRMDACETIGAATVICTDKTGTLTINEMRVAALFLTGKETERIPNDRFLRDLLLEAFTANTTAHLVREPGTPTRAMGNPTDAALLFWLQDQGIDYLTVRNSFPVRRQWTFTTERKFMATAGDKALHVKGAPEIVLGRCEMEQTPAGPVVLDEERRRILEEHLREFQLRGLRTLGFAYRPTPIPEAEIDDLATGLIWLGFAALHDPLRPDVTDAVAACRGAGVDVKIVTGDSPDTVREIARQVGLQGKELTGPEFAEMPDEAARNLVESLAILSRARPADKLRLVRLLRQRGQVVAVTGDGVNDGPALNHADVGLAMGKSGTAVAKEASDIILLDDSFQSIVLAVRWGRALYENIQRFILFQLTINVAALGLAVLGPFIGFALPLTVMQMLWVNLIMDTFAALALATEPPHDRLLKQPPRRPGEFIVTRVMALDIFLTAGLFLVTLIGLIFYLKSIGELPQTDAPSRGSTILFTVFVFLQFWNLFNAKCLGRKTSVFRTLLNNPAFLFIAACILAGQFFLVTFGDTAFRTVPLDWHDWLVIVGSTSVVLALGELRRILF